MADVLRTAWRASGTAVTFLAPFVSGAISWGAGSAAGVVVVFTVAGTDGPGAAIGLALGLLALFLAAVVAWGVWRCRRITAAYTQSSSPARHRKVA